MIQGTLACMDMMLSNRYDQVCVCVCVCVCLCKCVCRSERRLAGSVDNWLLCNRYAQLKTDFNSFRNSLDTWLFFDSTF
jgi:hypothetical protein